MSFVLRNAQCTITHGENIEVVEQHKILGQIIGSGLKTITNTESMCKKAFNRVWILRRLSNMLERVLKTALHIIYQDQYQSFKNALKLANISSLKDRRRAQITKFSKKCYKNNRFKSWFCHTEETSQPEARTLRSAFKSGPLLKPVMCRTQRYARSSIPAMTSILSWHPPLKYTPIDLA